MDLRGVFSMLLLGLAFFCGMCHPTKAHAQTPPAVVSTGTSPSGSPTTVLTAKLPAWSSGPSVQLLEVSFVQVGKIYEAQAPSVLSAGAGYQLTHPLWLNSDETMSYVNVTFPFFLHSAAGSPFSLQTGTMLGFANNVVGAGVVVDVIAVAAGGHGASGLLAGFVRPSNVYPLLNLNLEFDGASLLQTVLSWFQSLSGAEAPGALPKPPPEIHLPFGYMPVY